MMLKLKTLSYLFILLFLLILTGCEKEFNDSDIKASVSNNLSTAIIPSDFDYSLTKDINIEVKVDDQYSGEYHYLIEVFDSNPITNSDAILLSKGTANKDQDYGTTVTVPKTNTDAETVSYLYIRQTSPSGLSVIKMAEISDDDISVNFGTETAVKSLTKSSSFETKTTGEASEIDDSSIIREYTTPAGATPITATSGSPYTLTAGTNYIIPAGVTYSGTISTPNSDSPSLYIEGTWENNSESMIDIHKSKIIVQNGGKITSTVASIFSMNTSSLLFIADGGTFDGNNLSIDQNNKTGSEIVNFGIINCSDMIEVIGLYNYGTLTIGGTLKAETSNTEVLNEGNLIVGESMKSQGVFQNAATTTINGEFISTGSGFCLINNGFFETNNLTMQLSTIHNNGKFIINNDFTTISNTVTINIASGTIFKTKDYTANSGLLVNMEGNSIFEITKDMYLNNNISLSGPASGTDYALARLNSIRSAASWRHLDCHDNIEMESSDYSGVKINCDGNAKFVEEGSSDFTIDATDYNLGGNTFESGAPTEVPFPVIESSSNIYTYLFEDCWPDLGDYDMNDIVLDIKNISYSKNAENYIESMNITAVLRAVGGAYKLGGAIQLDGVESGNISSISRTTDIDLSDVNPFTTSNGIETGQTFAVIPLFNEAHAVLGVSKTMTNTRTDGEGNTAVSKTITITINFNGNSVSSSDLSMKKLNVFIVGYDDGIICADGKRREIHLAGYAPTDLGTLSLFNTGDDNSNTSDVNSLYKSKTNLIWGLAVPGSLSYPMEYKSITKAYPNFYDWTTSGGTTNNEWYNNSDSEFIY